MIKVRFPDGENVQEHLSITFEILKQLDEEFKNTNQILLDLSDMHWFIPCSIILISNKIKDLAKLKPKQISYIPPKNIKSNAHLEKIGFPLGNKEDGDSYVSIKHFSKDPKNKDQINIQVSNLINKIENKLPYEFGESINYIFAELSDNIDQHSDYKMASLMAQYYPTKKQVDIAVFDNGVSIPGLFEKNEIKFKEDFDAIKKAVFDGKTTKKEEPTRGFGLRTCRKLSIEGLKGELYLISRKGVIIMKSYEDPIFYDLENDSLQGTFIYLRLKTPKEKIDIYDYVE